MVTSWSIFILSGIVIVFAGTKLSRYGDQIAEMTGLGRLWIGVVLMAAATSTACVRAMDVHSASALTD